MNTVSVTREGGDQTILRPSLEVSVQLLESSMFVNRTGLYRQVCEFVHVCLDDQKVHNSGSPGKVSSTVPGNIKTRFINYSGLHLSTPYLIFIY